MDIPKTIAFAGLAGVYASYAIQTSVRTKTCPKLTTNTMNANMLDFLTYSSVAIATIPLVLLIVKMFNNHFDILLLGAGVMGAIASGISWKLNKDCGDDLKSRSIFWSQLTLALFTLVTMYAVYNIAFADGIKQNL